jgi:hypothetical protein
MAADADPNVSTPGYTRIRMVSYLAKVSEDSGASRMATRPTRDPLCAEKRARWTRTRATGLSGAHGKPPRLTGGAILGEMCEMGLRPTISQQSPRAVEHVGSSWFWTSSACLATPLGSPQILSRRHGNSFLVASGVCAARSLSTDRRLEREGRQAGEE